MIVYPDNTEIQEFVTKAQNKIADLSTFYVERGGDMCNELLLLLELSDFIECLDDPYNEWEEELIIKWIHGYNHRANLNSIVYLPLTGIEVTVVKDANSIGLPIRVSDISDYYPITNSLINAALHNNLSGIQPVLGYMGSNPTERYHLNKAMYDYLYNMMYPFIAPTVGLSVAFTPLATSLSGYYELGTSITKAVLQGSLVLNSGESINYYRYKRNGIAYAGFQVNNPSLENAILPYTDNTPIKTNTSFSFDVDFSQGGLKSAFFQVQFRQPMYYGVCQRNLITPQTAVTLTKYIGDRASMPLTFTVPTGNTELPYNTSKAMVVFIPFSWGAPYSMIVSSFDFISGWRFSNQIMTLADGTTQPGILGIYDTQTEGVTTFNMIY